MICYQCGSTLGSGRLCLRCGADVTIYKKIVRIANGYYNAGLEKARVRDLTGAIECLSKSLQFDKKNISARNLLGLIYYEMGEIVEALSHWVVSKNLMPENNPAEYYLNTVQNQKGELENMNQAIKKFNLALEYAQHDSEDLAIIQLKRVIGKQPKMMKAYQLLILLYIKEEDYSKAGKVLKRALQIDRGNTYCLKYTREIKGKISKPKAKQASYAEQQISQASDEEVIVPTYKERPHAIQLMIGLLMGLVIAVCGYYFLIQPSVERSNNSQWNQTAISYNEKLEEKDASINSLNASVSDLEGQIAALKTEMEQYNAEDGTITNYNRLLDAVDLYIREDWTGLAASFTAINQEAISSPSFATVYNTLQTFINGEDGMIDRIFQSAKALCDTNYYTEAIPILESCLALNPNYEAAIYYLGLCYDVKKEYSKAAEYFQDIVDRFPNGEYYARAYNRLQ